MSITSMTEFGTTLSNPKPPGQVALEVVHKMTVGEWTYENVCNIHTALTYIQGGGDIGRFPELAKAHCDWQPVFEEFVRYRTFYNYQVYMGEDTLYNEVTNFSCSECNIQKMNVEQFMSHLTTSPEHWDHLTRPCNEAAFVTFLKGTPFAGNCKKRVVEQAVEEVVVECRNCKKIVCARCRGKTQQCKKCKGKKCAGCRRIILTTSVVDLDVELDCALEAIIPMNEQDPGRQAVPVDLNFESVQKMDVIPEESPVQEIIQEKEVEGQKKWITQEMINKMEEKKKWKNVKTKEGKSNYKRLKNELKRATGKVTRKYLKTTQEIVVPVPEEAKATNDGFSPLYEPDCQIELDCLINELDLDLTAESTPIIVSLSDVNASEISPLSDYIDFDSCMQQASSSGVYGTGDGYKSKEFVDEKDDESLDNFVILKTVAVPRKDLNKVDNIIPPRTIMAARKDLSKLVDDVGNFAMPILDKETDVGSVKRRKIRIRKKAGESSKSIDVGESHNTESQTKSIEVGESNNTESQTKSKTKSRAKSIEAGENSKTKSRVKSIEIGESSKIKTKSVEIGESSKTKSVEIGESSKTKSRAKNIEVGESSKTKSIDVYQFEESNDAVVQRSKHIGIKRRANDGGGIEPKRNRRGRPAGRGNVKMNVGEKLINALQTSLIKEPKVRRKRGGCGKFVDLYQDWKERNGKQVSKSVFVNAGVAGQFIENCQALMGKRYDLLGDMMRMGGTDIFKAILHYKKEKREIRVTTSEGYKERYLCVDADFTRLISWAFTILVIKIGVCTEIITSKIRPDEVVKTLKIFTVASDTESEMYNFDIAAFKLLPSSERIKRCIFAANWYKSRQVPINLDQVMSILDDVSNEFADVRVNLQKMFNYNWAQGALDYVRVAIALIVKSMADGWKEIPNKVLNAQDAYNMMNCNTLWPNIFRPCANMAAKIHGRFVHQDREFALFAYDVSLYLAKNDGGKEDTFDSVFGFA